MARKSTWLAQHNVYGVHWRPADESVVVRLYAVTPKGPEQPIELTMDTDTAVDLAHRLIQLAMQYGPQAGTNMRGRKS